jgi:hypothetical protein
MRRLLTVIASLALLVSAAVAQVPMTGAGLGAPSSGGFTPSCSQSSTFLARTSGLNLTEETAYDTMICGMVTDGTWCGTTIDALYIFATNTTTTANLNLCSSSYALTSHGTISFSADHGYTGNGTTGYLDTGFNASTAGGNFTLNSGHVGAYVLTSRSSNQNYFEVGSSDKVSSATSIQPLAGGDVFASVNDGGSNVVTNSNAQGLWIGSRTGSVTQTIYKNGSSFGTPNNASVSVNNLNFYISARNGAGTADDFSTDQLSAVFFGAGLNATKAGNISSRINAFMTALGINVY